jgi:hypothetical protein
MPGKLADFHQSLDAYPVKRGKQFEHFVKWFLKADPEWSTQVDQVVFTRCQSPSDLTPASH